MSAEAGRQDLNPVLFLEQVVLPRLSAEDLFDHPAHQFSKSEEKWRGGCPRHQSKSGTSFTVDPVRLLWHCAGCGVGGGPLQYPRWLRDGDHESPRGQDFLSAASELARRVGLDMPSQELSKEQLEEARRRDLRRSMLSIAYQHFAETLWSPVGEEARAYLHSRGFTEEAIRQLGLGLCNDLKNLAAALETAGFDPFDVHDSGLIWPKLEGFITTPWLDEHGSALTIYGRWYQPVPIEKRDHHGWDRERDRALKEWESLSGEERETQPWVEPRIPKTTSLPGRFTKASPLYLDRALKARHKQLVLVEGVLDAALAQASGDTSVVACVGAMLSKEQVHALVRSRVESVTICLDPDVAGENGVRSCIRLLDKARITPYVAPPLPEGMDPDEFLMAKGLEAWRTHVGAAVHAYRFVAEDLARQVCPDGNWTDQRLTQLHKEAAALGARLQDPAAAQQFFWPTLETACGKDLTALAAADPGAGEGKVTIQDFRAYMLEHKYPFLPTGELWPAASVDGHLPPVDTGERDKNGEKVFISASKWLDQNAAVHQMTWAPGWPTLIEERLIVEGGWIDRSGCVIYNQYISPRTSQGDPKKVEPWWHHLCRAFGDQAEHMLAWFAHRIQRPGEKINHALVLGGCQGIGKDTLLDPVRYAIGPWNFADVSPIEILGRFNGFRKSVILRVSEVRDLGDVDRYAFYEHMKIYTAAPPDTLRVDEEPPGVRGAERLWCDLDDQSSSGWHLPPPRRPTALRRLVRAHEGRLHAGLLERPLGVV